MKTKNLLRSLLLVAVLGIALLVPMATAQALDIDLGTGSDSLCGDMDPSVTGVLGCQGDQVTSFTYYEGEFAAPDAEGYDEGLTRATSAREFILNVTNFALSFLGLVAVIIIVYGGFLYVTAGGKDEQTEKGKKSVMYAVIGIIIVLSSYAIVNTLISEAPGGGEDRGQGGVYSSGDGVTGEEVDIYNVNYIADELQDLTQSYVGNFTTYSNVFAYLDYAENTPAPELIKMEIPAIEGIDPASGFLSFLTGMPIFIAELSEEDKNYVYDDTSMALLREHAETMHEVAEEILDLVDTYSETYEAALELEDYTDAVVSDLNAYEEYLEGLQQEFGSQGFDLFSFLEVPKAQARVDTGEMKGYEGKLYELLYGIRSAAMDDFNSQIIDYYEDLQELAGPFDADVYSGYDILPLGWEGSNLSLIDDKFEEIIEYFEEGGRTKVEYVGVEHIYEEDYDIIEFVDNSVMRDVVEELGTLYSYVENLQFVTAVISGSVTQVNAPAVVSFNGLSSYDPSDLTITDMQYNWDLDGDGQYGESGNQECMEDHSATVSCTYRDPGTYRVGLRILSNDTNIAPGQSYVSITVLPPTSQLVVTAYTSVGDPIPLADYENNISESDTKFTLEEGKAGITIDLDGTVDGNGDPTAYHKLDCGNGTEFESESLINEVCTYEEEGTYDLVVEVTDVLGNTDRYIGDMVIASPASRIVLDSYTYAVNDTIFADGAASTTDKGSIVQYSWEANGEAVSTGEELEYKVLEPGKFKLSLEVVDSANEKDKEYVAILVESQNPIAKYEYDIPDPSQPNVVFFDASGSYDPDENDTISFEWDFGSIEHEYLQGTNKNSEKPIVKFGETGDVDVILEVSDQYEDEELQKTTALEEIFNLDSILDVSVDVPLGAAQQLDEGEIELQFTLTSENGEVFEIKYGDGEEEFVSKSTGISASVTHTYTEVGVYVVEVSAYDADDNENTFSKKVYIGESDSPIAVVEVLKDGNSVGDIEVAGSVNTVFTFDASESKNTDGSSRNLEYSWDFGDNSRSTEKSATHTFDETGTFEVTLTVTDEDDSTVRAEDTFEVTVSEDPPEINSLMYTIESDTLVTPVKVTAEVDAEDSDGKITNYLWYFYDITDSTEKLGAQITTSKKAEFTIPTRGSTGEEKTYAFVVEVTDSGGNTVSSTDVFSESEVPTIEVENGLNESPVAEFTVSDTFLMLGDSVTLSSTSYDPDGDDITYVWDVEGDGFSNNEETSNATIIFAPDTAGCFDIRLKVIDDKEQADVAADSVEVCVEAITEPPSAAFTYELDKLEVSFVNNSEVDTENGAEVYAYYWDFDTASDTDGDGNASNDIDSTEESPTYKYAKTGTYKVSLNVYDNAGGTDSVEHSIAISETEPPTAGFTYDVLLTNVSFENTSTTSGADITLLDYGWDFDTSVDSNGDGDKSNDYDSREENPVYRYEDYGTYTVKLTVLDSMGQIDYVTRTVEVEQTQEELIGYLTTNPAASPVDSKIHLSSPSGYVDMGYSTSLSSGEGVSCWLDKNVYYDTDGDDVKNNDHDFEQQNCTSGSFDDVYFEESWGLIVVMLTVEDEQGNSYTVTKEVVFDTELGGANIFPVSGTQGFVLMIVALSFALLGASIYTVRRIN